MQKWVADGLIVGFATVAFGSAASALLPGNSIASVATSGFGAVSSSMVLSRRRTAVLPKSAHSRGNAQTYLPKPQIRSASKGISSPIKQANSTQATPLSRRTPESYFKESPVEELSTDVEAIGDEKHQSLSKLLSEDVAIAWLANRQISVMDRADLDPHVEAIFNKHAIKLGDKYKDEDGQPQSSLLLKQIKWSIANQRGVQCHLSKVSQKQIGTITQIAGDLDKDTLFFSKYKYVSSEKVIHAVIQERQDTRSFFTGNWFERFVEYKVSDLLQRSNLSYTRLMNRIIRFSNGDSFELDLFYLIEGRPLLIECKTGKERDAYQKFSDRRKRLSISPARAFLVVLDFDPSETERLSAVWKLNIVGQDNLIPQMEAVIGSN